MSATIVAPAQPSALIHYPQQAFFGRTLPKNKIYEHSGASARLKELFVAQVEQIVWQYKLAPETINLPAKASVPEIQVFRIVLKTAELAPEVLACIDGAVQFPLLFELEHGGKTKVVAAHKRPSEANPKQWITSDDYFSSPWLPADSPRSEMPVALDLAGLYHALLLRLLPLAPRPHENLADLVQRLASVRAKQLQIDKTRAKLAKEKQFNRKVEINAALRQLNQELAALRHCAP